MKEKHHITALMIAAKLTALDARIAEISTSALQMICVMLHAITIMAAVQSAVGMSHCIMIISVLIVQGTAAGVMKKIVQTIVSMPHLLFVAISK